MHLKLLGFRNLQKILVRGLSSRSVFPDRSKPPGLGDRLKLWWAKEVTPDYHVAGRLSERQIKYASEGGFRSVLSLYGNQDGGDFGGEYLPSRSEAKDIAEECGLQYASLLSTGEDWCSADAVKKMAQVLPNLKAPVLLHSNHGRAISFVLLANLAQSSRNINIDSKRFHEIAARMGLSFGDEAASKVISEITGEPVIKDTSVSNAQPEDWFKYWLAHPVYKNWFTSGQITRTHIPVLERAGFKSVICMRLGLTSSGKNSQEEVNLLNIPEFTGTYGTEKNKPRQHKERLEETRLDFMKPNSYIGRDSLTNYETRNQEEFGDSVGFNVELEKEAFQQSSLDFYHLPLAVGAPHAPYFEETLETIAEIGSRGPVLVQCARAFRAAYAAVLAAAVQENLALQWAETRCAELGYPISKDKTPDIYAVYEKYLSKT